MIVLDFPGAVLLTAFDLTVVAVAVALAVGLAGLRWRWKSPSAVGFYGGLFTTSITLFCLGKVFLQPGTASALLAVPAGATCGWSWLLSRALFRQENRRAVDWPLVTVLILMVTGAFPGPSGMTADPWLRIIGNAHFLISSTVLLLALAEPLRGLSGLARAEVQFRWLFAVGYAVLLTFGVVIVQGAPAGSLLAQMSDALKLTCGLLALLGAGLAVVYRRRRPMAVASTQRPRRAATEADAALAQRVRDLMYVEAIYTDAGLKVASLARRVGEAEYKVTQCITGALGFRNFNHMVNHFRVEAAKSLLATPQYDHLPVLTIAMDCGFGSIGPFNRAFKAEVGLTPTQFRDSRMQAKAA